MKLDFECKYYDVCDYYVIQCPYGPFEVYITYNYKSDSKCLKCDFLKVDCYCQKPIRFDRDIPKNKRTLLLLKEKALSNQEIKSIIQYTDDRCVNTITKECCHNSFDKMKEIKMDKVTLKFSEAKRVVRKAGIKNIQKYVSLRRTGKLPAGLPSDPKTAYARYWKDWQDFCGTQTEVK